MHASMQDLTRHLLLALNSMNVARHIKTHGSESRGQEEAACTRVFWPTRPLQLVSYLHGWQL